jgi:hypothetical protein
VQLRVDLGEAKRYIYLWWYGTDGEPRRLWPPVDCDLEGQAMCSLVVSPDVEDEDKWWPIEGTPGIETALAAVTDEPLTAVQLSELEQLFPYPYATEIRLPAPREIRPGDRPNTERNLGARPEISAKYPISGTLRKELQSRFESFHAIVIPHR